MLAGRQLLVLYIISNLCCCQNAGADGADLVQIKLQQDRQTTSTKTRSSTTTMMVLSSNTTSSAQTTPPPKLDYCLKLTHTGGSSPYRPADGIWRVGKVLNEGMPVLLKKGGTIGKGNHALVFSTAMNPKGLLPGCNGDWSAGALVLDKWDGSKWYHADTGTFNWGFGGCHNAAADQVDDIKNILQGSISSFTVRHRARTNHYGPSYADVLYEKITDISTCGGDFEAVDYGTVIGASPTTKRKHAAATVTYTRYPKQFRKPWLPLKGDDLIPTNPPCVKNDDWTFPYCRLGKFPQTLAIGPDRCKMACEARPKCVDIAIGHPAAGINAVCMLMAGPSDNAVMVTHANWDWYARTTTPVSYTYYPKQVRKPWGDLAGDDLIPTNPPCVKNDDWTFPYCRLGKFPQTLAIGPDRCKMACEARPKCVDIAIGHPTAGINAVCMLMAAPSDNAVMVHAAIWDWYARGAA